MTKRSWLSAAFLMIVIPALLYLSFRLGNRYYYLASFGVVIASMIPFFLSFERRKPQAREMSVLATMCALAIASRAAAGF